MKTLPSKGIAAIAVLLALGLTGAFAVNSDLTAKRDQAAEQQLKELEQSVCHQALSGNTSALLDGIADDLIVMQTGISEGKLQWEEQDREAFSRDIVNSNPKLAELKVDNLEARVHGQTGIVRGKMFLKQKDGMAFESRFIDTFERRNGRWILVATANSGQQIK